MALRRRPDDRQAPIDRQPELANLTPSAGDWKSRRGHCALDPDVCWLADSRLVAWPVLWHRSGIRAWRSRPPTTRAFSPACIDGRMVGRDDVADHGTTSAATSGTGERLPDSAAVETGDGDPVERSPADAGAVPDGVANGLACLRKASMTCANSGPRSHSRAIAPGSRNGYDTAATPGRPTRRIRPSRCARLEAVGPSRLGSRRPVRPVGRAGSVGACGGKRRWSGKSTRHAERDTEPQT